MTKQNKFIAQDRTTAQSSQCYGHAVTGISIEQGLGAIGFMAVDERVTWGGWELELLRLRLIVLPRSENILLVSLIFQFNACALQVALACRHAVTFRADDDRRIAKP